MSEALQVGDRVEYFDGGKIGVDPQYLGQKGIVYAISSSWITVHIDGYRNHRTFNRTNLRKLPTTESKTMEPKWMTLAEFKAKWDTGGVYPGQCPKIWRIDGAGNIEVNSAYISCGPMQYSGWDAYLTALGCKPVDPRDAVFKAYGWIEVTNSDRRKWRVVLPDGHTITVHKDNGDCTHVCSPIAITTAAQAEALCVLMGLTKAGAT